MNHKAPVLIFFLVAVVGVLIFSPIGRGSSLADLGTVVQVGPDVFVAEMDNQVCLSESEIHTTGSQTTASADAEEDAMPSVFLMMLDDGVCASLSPISSTTRIQAEPAPEKEEIMDKKEAALGAKPGVWYVQN